MQSVSPTTSNLLMQLAGRREGNNRCSRAEESPRPHVGAQQWPLTLSLVVSPHSSCPSKAQFYTNRAYWGLVAPSVVDGHKPAIGQICCICARALASIPSLSFPAPLLSPWDTFETNKAGDKDLYGGGQLEYMTTAHVILSSCPCPLSSTREGNKFFVIYQIGNFLIFP